jgi:hypothetical protein
MAHPGYQRESLLIDCHDSSARTEDREDAGQREGVERSNDGKIISNRI